MSRPSASYWLVTRSPRPVTHAVWLPALSYSNRCSTPLAASYVLRPPLSYWYVVTWGWSSAGFGSIVLVTVRTRPSSSYPVCTVSRSSGDASGWNSPSGLAAW